MKAPLKIAVLVSGGGTNLEALFNAENSGKIQSGKIYLVISDKQGVFALKRAEKRGVESIVIEKKNFDSAESFNAEILKTLRQKKIDLCILAGFLSIITEPLLCVYKNRIINIHPSLLPAYGGKNFYGIKVHEAVINAKEKITGATVHFVDSTIDGGKIIAQKKVEVKDGDTPLVLQKRVMEEAEWQILAEATEEVCAELPPFPPLLIGLTGLYCAGKNYAASILEKNEIPVFDVDKAGHEALEIQKEKIINIFGTDIIDDKNNINRKKLGKKVFGNKNALKKLEEIVHPEVDKITEKWLAAQKGRLSVINAALLHKCACFGGMDAVIVIRAPFIARLWRAKRRDKLPIIELLKRFFAQSEFNAKYFTKNADNNIRIVNNLGRGLEKKIMETLTDIKERRET